MLTIILDVTPIKLARPDLFHPKIVLAGCAKLIEGDGDDAGLVPALAKRGLYANWLSWDDPETLTADLVILRATWDYVERLDEFLAWSKKVRNLLNTPAVVAWNTDKHYLHDLAVAGVPVVESEFFEPGQDVHLPAGQVVIKPAIGAGSVGAQRFNDNAKAREHTAALQEAGSTVLVQPYNPKVAEGETAMVFLGGKASHAFTKGPMLPEPGGRQVFDASGTYATEELSPADPEPEFWDVGHAAVAAAAEHLDLAPTELLYARVDVIGSRDEPQLLELELVEPSLGWGQLDVKTRGLQQRQFALEVESALDRLGLGALSHRRP